MTARTLPRRARMPLPRAGIANRVRECASHAAAGARGTAIRPSDRGVVRAGGEEWCFVRRASFLPAADGEGAAVELAARETGLGGNRCSSIPDPKLGERR